VGGLGEAGAMQLGGGVGGGRGCLGEYNALTRKR